MSFSSIEISINTPQLHIRRVMIFNVLSSLFYYIVSNCRASVVLCAWIESEMDENHGAHGDFEIDTFYLEIKLFINEQLYLKRTSRYKLETCSWTNSGPKKCHIWFRKFLPHIRIIISLPLQNIKSIKFIDFKFRVFFFNF